MNVIPTKIEGVFIIETDIFQDERGSFVKTFHKDIFNANNLSVDFEESFYSISNKNVIRGMHIQLPPKDHFKLVFVTKGAILDVVLDLRKGSPTYGVYSAIELSEKNHKGIYMPPGCAHGFLSLEDDSCTVYLQTATHSKEHDTGVRVDSFGMEWGVEKPIISKRDQEFDALEKFISPFIYQNEITH
jgi:dTDP-4-dehydrorhamnose 3,5-epimerase